MTNDQPPMTNEWPISNDQCRERLRDLFRWGVGHGMRLNQRWGLGIGPSLVIAPLVIGHFLLSIIPKLLHFITPFPP